MLSGRLSVGINCVRLMLAVDHAISWPIKSATNSMGASGKVAARECAWSIAKSKPGRAVSDTGTAKVDLITNVIAVTRECNTVSVAYRPHSFSLL